MSRPVALLIVACLCAYASAAASLTRATAQGNVTGYNTTTHYIFKGVPFAAPPVGTLRFSPPQAPASRSSTLVLPKSSNPACDTQEDCLYLDIYVPIGVTSASPVMLWIHGGAYTYDGSYNYDGQYLTAGTTTVYVAINYRLGAFGFLALNETFTRDGTTGNYGHQDQRFAMQWVYNNIANFGGSPSKITIAGQSAGGHSVCSHLGNPRSSGLYRSALIHSTYSSCSPRSLSSAISSGKSWAQSLNCTSTGAALLTCINNLAASKIFPTFVNDHTGSVWYTCADKYEFNTTNGYTNIQLASIPKVPVFIGTNSGENDASTNSQTFACTARSVSNYLSPLAPIYTYFLSFGNPAHGGELQYLWPAAFAPYGFSAGGQAFSNILKSYTLSFVADQVPTSTLSNTVVWNKYNTTFTPYINLNVTASMATNFFPGRTSC